MIGSGKSGVCYSNSTGSVLNLPIFPSQHVPVFISHMRQVNTLLVFEK